MSALVPYAMLGLLARRSRHGYELKRELERALGGNRGVNFGQVYTTLARLERDGLVAIESRGGDGRGKKTYRITSKGRKELTSWLDLVDERTRPLGDGFPLKLIVRNLAGLGNAKAAIARQRQAYLQHLGVLARLAAGLQNDPYVSLLVEGTVLHLQADLGWLDLCDERLPASDGGAP